MKNVFITGSTDGIGKIAAIKLAKRGFRIYIHGRNKEKVDNVIAEIKDISNNNNIDGFVADFSQLKAVKKMSEEVLREISELDILINNAGIFKSNTGTTSDGHDIRFSVNYFAPYILTNALLPLLRNGRNARIINLSSAAQSSVSFDALKGHITLSAQAAYAQSKLALTMWSFDLAKQEQGIIVIPVNPGSLLNTKMVKEAYGQHWAPADKGANILEELATNQNLIEKSGMYFDNDKGSFGKAHQDAYDVNLIKELLKETADIIKQI